MEYLSIYLRCAPLLLQRSVLCALAVLSTGSGPSVSRRIAPNPGGVHGPARNTLALLPSLLPPCPFAPNPGGVADLGASLQPAFYLEKPTRLRRTLVGYAPL